MSGCLSFPCRICAIVYDLKHSCSNLPFRGVCTLFSWEVWSVQWEAALCNHLRLQNPVGGWLHVEPLHLCLCLSIKDFLKLPAAVILQKSHLMGPVPAWGGESCSPELSFESHLCGAVVIFLLLLNFCSSVLLRTFWLDAKDHVSMMNGVGTDSLLVKCFGNLPSERLCIGKWEAEVWITVMPSLAKLPRLRPWGLNSKLLQFFSMGLWRTFLLLFFVWVTMKKLHVSS